MSKPNRGHGIFMTGQRVKLLADHYENNALVAKVDSVGTVVIANRVRTIEEIYGWANLKLDSGVEIVVRKNKIARI